MSRTVIPLPGTLLCRCLAAHRCASNLATYPEVVARRAGAHSRLAIPSLFGLAPCGVCHAFSITAPFSRASRFRVRPREWRRAERLAPFAHPKRCALTAPFHPYRFLEGSATLGAASPLILRSRRYIFCGTGRKAVLKPPSRTLSGTLLFGVRTFLSHARARPG